MTEPPGNPEPLGKGKLAKKALIMDVTKRMIEDHGYQQTTTNKIAQSAGISIGLVYKYFPGGKIDILREIGLLELQKVRSHIQQDVEGLSASTLPVAISHFIRHMLDQHKTNQRISAALDIAILSSDPDARALNTEIQDVNSSNILPTEQLKSLGISISAERMESLRKLVHACIHWHLNMELLSKTDDGFVETMTEVCLALLRSHPQP